MKKLLICVICAVFSYAQIIKTTKEVRGFGLTEEKAIYNGLIHALEQINGVAIRSSKTVVTESLKSKLLTPNGNLKIKLSSKKSISAVSAATKGLIDNYNINNIQRTKGGYVASLSVTIGRYKAPGFNPNKRRKMAIMPFEFKSSYDILGAYESGKAVSDRFTQSLVSKMTQSRKFTILDRENSNYYQAEKNFLLSGNSSQDELLKLGKRLGTDYLLIGKILDLSIQKITEKSNIGLPSTSQIVCNATISYRILMMATQQVKWSETISKQFNIEENSNLNSKEAVVANATDKISGLILTNILNNIFPPRIVAVTRNSVIINQGGNSIENGDVYKVFKTGKRLVDPYTREFLGYEEIESGKIEITKVNPKVSYAKVLDGLVSEGMILRKSKSNNSKSFQSEGEATTDVKITDGGGVKLPFDN